MISYINYAEYADTLIHCTNSKLTTCAVELAIYPVAVGHFNNFNNEQFGTYARVHSADNSWLVSMQCEYTRVGVRKPNKIVRTYCRYGLTVLLY